jgi:hypothetical protein
LAALVEDWALCYESLSDTERDEYLRAILALIPRLGPGEAAREGLAIAAMAEIPFPAHLDRGVLAAVPGTLLKQPATRLSATAVLARGHSVSVGDDSLRDWLRPLFERAREQIRAKKDVSLAVLTLQAPYRL